jgi:hypothetical protein
MHYHQTIKKKQQQHSERLNIIKNTPYTAPKIDKYDATSTYKLTCTDCKPLNIRDKELTSIKNNTEDSVFAIYTLRNRHQYG